MLGGTFTGRVTLGPTSSVDSYRDVDLVESTRNLIPLQALELSALDEGSPCAGHSKGLENVKSRSAVVNKSHGYQIDFFAVHRSTAFL